MFSSVIIGMKKLVLFLLFFLSFFVIFTATTSLSYAQNVGQQCTGALTNDPNGRCGPAATGVVDGICTGTFGITSNCVVNRQPDGGLCGTDNNFCKSGYCNSRTGKCETPPGPVCTSDSGAKGFCEIGYCGTWGTSLNRTEYPDGKGTCNQTFGGWGPNNPVNFDSCCVPKKPDGSSCRNNDQCINGNCTGTPLTCQPATSSGISLPGVGSLPGMPGTTTGTRSCLGKYGEQGTCGDTYGWTAVSVGWSCPSGMVDGNSTNNNSCGWSVPCCIRANTKITPTPGPAGSGGISFPGGITLPTLPVGSPSIPTIPGVTFKNPVSVGSGTTGQSCTGIKGTGKCATNYCDSITGLCGGICSRGEVNVEDSTSACGQFVSCCAPATATGTTSPGYCKSAAESGVCATDLASQLYGKASTQYATALGTGACPSGYHNINADSKYCGFGRQCCVQDDPNAPSNQIKLCKGANNEPGQCAPSVGVGNVRGGMCLLVGLENIGKDNFDQQSCGMAVQCCGKKAKSSTPTPTPRSGSGSGSGGGGPSSGSGGGSRPPSGSGGSSGGGGAPQASCPANGDTCIYSEKDSNGNTKCYSGTGATGFNQPGCRYSCGPVPCPDLGQQKKPSGKKVIDCNPGDAVNEFDDIPCPKGKKGTCGGHSYCVYDENGNYESEPICETEKDTCSEGGGSTSSGNNACKDNPTSPPDGYTWKNSCKSCGNNDDCPKNTNDAAVNPETSNWCFSGSCLMLVSGGSGGSSRSSKDDEKEERKAKEKKKKEAEKKKKEKEKKKKAQKTAEEKAKKAQKEGKNTGTTAEATQAPSPTLMPPLPEPANWSGFCGQTTDPARPWGVQLKWDAVPGATRYAVRLDEDAPSWEGDTPSPGDTVDNQFTGTVYSRQAKAPTPGQPVSYTWWVHSVNASGVYSALSKKLSFKCEAPAATSGTPAPQGVGAQPLIVLPPANSSTAVPTAPTPTLTPIPTPTPKR